LWLLPSLAIGLAFALELVARVVRRNLPSSAPALSIGLVVVAGVVVGGKLDDGLLYLDSGAPSTRRFVEERAGDRDLIVVLSSAVWHYAAQPGVRVDIQPAPDTEIGFLPRLVDPRVWVQTPTWNGSTEQLQQRLVGARRVFVLDGIAGSGAQIVTKFDKALASLGYRQRPGSATSIFRVFVWERTSS
jgi:hypothetical protein